MADAMVRESLQANLKFRWTALIRRRLEGLTDAEYLWEPAAGCLTIRRGGDGYVLDPVGSTDIPLGNIAWRMAHLAFSLSSHPIAVVAFGPNWPRPDLAAPAGTVGEALARLDSAHAHWEAALGRLSDFDLARNFGPAAGEYSTSTALDLVLHIHAEVLQRGADLCLLRDLYWHLHGRPA
ncbi:MAG: DinB family protein [Candidatus Dormibacterales bacterium]